MAPFVPNYRKRQGLPISEQKIIEAQANVLRMRVTRLLRGVDLESPNQFPRLDVDSFADGPQEIARRVRADWHLPSGPIRSVTGAIESAGGFVFRRPFGTTQLDAVIQSPNGLCPLFLINSNVPAGDRLRFTLAHEIGHVVMRNSLSPDPEKEANDFASEFLMPAREIAGDLNDFGLAKALRLKPYWKVSIQALIRRAYDLGKISPRKYRSLFTQLSASGWRVREPIPIPVETPTLIHDIVTVHVDQLNMNYGEICRTLVSREDDFRSQFCAEDPRLRGFGIVG